MGSQMTGSKNIVALSYRQTTSLGNAEQKQVFGTMGSHSKFEDGTNTNDQT